MNGGGAARRRCRITTSSYLEALANAVRTSDWCRSSRWQWQPRQTPTRGLQHPRVKGQKRRSVCPPRGGEQDVLRREKRSRCSARIWGDRRNRIRINSQLLHRGPCGSVLGLCDRVVEQEFGLPCRRLSLGCRDLRRRGVSSAELEVFGSRSRSRCCQDHRGLPRLSPLAERQSIANRRREHCGRVCERPEAVSFHRQQSIGVSVPVDEPVAEIVQYGEPVS